jgi:hypothetical protein
MDKYRQCIPGSVIKKFMQCTEHPGVLKIPMIGAGMQLNPLVGQTFHCHLDADTLITIIRYPPEEGLNGIRGIPGNHTGDLPFHLGIPNPLFAAGGGRKHRFLHSGIGDYADYFKGIVIDFLKCLSCADKSFCAMCMVRNANENPDGDPLKINEHFCKVAALNRKIVLDWKEKLQA